jgi:hypothetical protein
LLLASRESPGQLTLPFGQPWEKLVHSRLTRPYQLSTGPDDVAAKVEVLLDREDVEDAPALRHLAQTNTHNDVRFQPGDAATVEGDRAGPRPKEAGDRSERCALTRAVAAQNCHDLARLGVERDAFESFDAAVEDVEVANLEQGHG